jgi:hypothetical protein
VIFSTEDGPATLDNQLYMYVGEKRRSAHASVLKDGMSSCVEPGGVEGRWPVLRVERRRSRRARIAAARPAIRRGGTDRAQR